jgi:hypothetical protein
VNTTQAKWAERVAAWRKSGDTAPAFCAGKGFEASTLRYWASRLRRPEVVSGPRDEVRIARVVRGTAGGDVDSPIVVEVGRARIAIRRGCDRDALRAVFELLDEREAAR